MSVKIRLMRVGKRKQPSYRVVVADERQARDGRILETIGNYGPRQDPSHLEIKSDRALDWLRKGAKPTESVQKLLTVSGVWAEFLSEKSGPVDTKLNRRGFSTGRAVTTKTKKRPEPGVAAPAVKKETAEEVAEEVVAEVAAEEVVAEVAAEEVVAEEVVAEVAAEEVVEVAAEEVVEAAAEESSE